MTLVEGDELQRLWALVSELSSQLASNREACASLQQQADDLKVSWSPPSFSLICDEQYPDVEDWTGLA